VKYNRIQSDSEKKTLQSQTVDNYGNL